MIRLSRAGRTYRMGRAAVHALREVDLEIGPGEYVAVLGPSGSGKSTLLHIMGCLDTPTSGTYLLDGVNVGGLNLNQLADIRNRKVGFVFQRFHLMPRASALQNVMMPLSFAGVGLHKRRPRAEALLRRVGLGDRLHHRPAELSGGEQQRVAVARALANEPPMILADEPTGNLDSRSGKEIISLLEELHTEGRTIILVTHDEHLARRAHRVIRLLDGRIVSDGREDRPPAPAAPPRG